MSNGSSDQRSSPFGRKTAPRVQSVPRVEQVQKGPLPRRATLGTQTVPRLPIDRLRNGSIRLYETANFYAGWPRFRVPTSSARFHRPRTIDRGPSSRAPLDRIERKSSSPWGIIVESASKKSLSGCRQRTLWGVRDVCTGLMCWQHRENRLRTASDLIIGHLLPRNLITQDVVRRFVNERAPLQSACCF